MPQLRQDPIAGYWVAIAQERSHRPFDYERSPIRAKAGSVCPFCPGNESQTPRELLSYPGAEANTWRLRVIPNKFPAFETHEVIIDSPEHKDCFGDLPDSAAFDLLSAVRDRMLALKQDPDLEYLQFFKNNGPGSGASLSHPHSQLIGLPTVPVQVQLELDGSLHHYEEHRECIFCDLIRLETEQHERVISDRGGMLVLSPYAPRFGFETWILPGTHGSHFEDSDGPMLEAAATALRETIRRLEMVLDRTPYNILLHTAPVQEPTLPYYHWHFEILPRMSGVGGFEFGTGSFINTIAPEESAKVLREISK